MKGFCLTIEETIDFCNALQKKVITALYASADSLVGEDSIRKIKGIVAEQASEARFSAMLGVDEEGYWCVVCGKFLPSNDGVIVHDDVQHPDTMNFDDEENPQ